MQNNFEKTRVLITVMTYPHPSVSYRELVCTAGITDNYNWVRLYPIDYRYMPPEKKFKKYQYINIELEPSGHGNDGRKESRKPRLDTLEILGEPLSTKNKWRERNRIIENVPHYTLNKLREQYNIDKTSLGIVRPTCVRDIIIERSNKDWKPEWREMFRQTRLFGEDPKPLFKIPYKFSYVFECNDSVKPHKASITDWELGMLYINELKRIGIEKVTAESVKDKYLNELCSESRDVRFFMGTFFPYNTWLVLGVYWPPKEGQGFLF